MRKCIFSARPKDFRVDTFAAGGPGGQHSNKTQTGVRITHLPSGLSAECRETRSQDDNWKRAWRRLAQRLVQWVLAQQETPAERPAEVVRTYNEPDNRVVDHRTGARGTYRAVLDGNLEALVEARRRAD